MHVQNPIEHVSPKALTQLYLVMRIINITYLQ